MRRSFLALCSFLLATGCSRPESGPFEVQISVKVPDDAATVFLAGNLPELGPWDPGLFAMHGEGGERTAVITVPAGHELEYKFTLGSWEREGLGPSGTVMPNFRLSVESDTSVVNEIVDFSRGPDAYIADPEGSGVQGRLVYWKEVASEHVSQNRTVGIWLPPGYDESDRRYRVLYMHDGQNLFDPRIANTGVDWGVDEAMMSGVDAGVHEPAIVVSTFNTSRRLQEYSPWHEGPQFARFLVEELMPRVNDEFRTLTGPENTFVMGSSMGGLISFYLVKEHPDVFGACGCVSSHFVLSARMVSEFMGGEDRNPTPFVVRDIEDGDTAPEGARFFFDYGTEGLDASYGPTHERVRQWLEGQGFEDGPDFLIREYEGADHNEASWRARLGDQLVWMLAPAG